MKAEVISLSLSLSLSNLTLVPYTVIVGCVLKTVNKIWHKYFSKEQ